MHFVAHAYMFLIKSCNTNYVGNTQLTRHHSFIRQWIHVVLPSAVPSVSGSSVCSPSASSFLAVLRMPRHPSQQTTSLLIKITCKYSLSSYNFPALYQLKFCNKRPTSYNRHPRLYNDFMSEGLIFAYQQPHHRINKIN